MGKRAMDNRSEYLGRLTTTASCHYFFFLLLLFFFLFFTLLHPSPIPPSLLSSFLSPVHHLIESYLSLSPPPPPPPSPFNHPSFTALSQRPYERDNFTHVYRRRETLTCLNDLTWVGLCTVHRHFNYFFRFLSGTVSFPAFVSLTHQELEISV
ncbi:hypothetical protein IWX49DRAFT_111040 [Phyllosticta citricarpa]